MHLCIFVFTILTLIVFDPVIILHLLLSDDSIEHSRFDSCFMRIRINYNKLIFITILTDLKQRLSCDSLMILSVAHCLQYFLDIF